MKALKGSLLSDFVSLISIIITIGIDFISCFLKKNDNNIIYDKKNILFPFIYYDSNFFLQVRQSKATN